MRRSVKGILACAAVLLAACQDRPYPTSPVTEPGPSAVAPSFSQAPLGASGPDADVGVGEIHTCSVLATGAIRCWGNDFYGAAAPDGPGDAGYARVSSGVSYSCALRADGSITCWGSGEPEVEGGPWVQMDAGDEQLCAITQAGALECFTEQGLVFSTGDSYTQVSASTDHFCAVQTNGDVRCFGESQEQEAEDMPAEGGGFVQVATAEHHTCALRADGRMRCSGFLGDSVRVRTVEPAASPWTQIEVGWYSTCAVRADGLIECWPESDFTVAPELRVAQSGTYARLDMKHAEACAVTTTNHVECWDPVHGDVEVPADVNENTQVGLDQQVEDASGYSVVFDEVTASGVTLFDLGATAPALPGYMVARSPVAAISTSATHAGPARVCFAYGGAVDDATRLVLLRADGAGGLEDVTTSQSTAEDVLCGEVDGLGTFIVAEATDALPAVPAELLSVGGAHSCAVSGSGEIVCWGDNGRGQAGTHAAAAGSFVRVGAAPGTHTCGVTDAGTVECWGTDRSGEAPGTRSAPAGAYTQVSASNTLTCAVTSTGVVDCFGGDAAVHTPSAGAFVQVDNGQNHACAVTDTGALECWGFDYLGSAPALVTGAAGGFRHVSGAFNVTCAVSAAGTVRCFGDNGDGDAPASRLGASGSFVQVSLGGNHGCGVTTAGVVECWGQDDAGEAPASRSASSGVFVQVGAGGGHSCARTSTGAIECWGSDAEGQATPPAGLSTTQNTPAGTQVVAEPEPGVTLTFDDVQSAGATTVTTSASGEPLPEGFQLGDPPLYWDIETTATFTGAIEVCLSYAGLGFGDEGSLRLLHYEEGTGWEDVTTSLDTDADVICGQVSSLSPFVVAQPSNQAPTADASASAGAAQCTLASAGGTEVRLDGTASGDADGEIVEWRWTDASGALLATGDVALVDLALGMHEITLTVTDDDGATASTAHTVHVRDTQAPGIAFELEVDTLWSPDHRMVTVATGVGATDGCDPAPELGIEVSSNQPVDGAGDGSTSPDWEVVQGDDGRYEIRVRAERAGGQGDRLYTISVSATDASGNTATGTGVVAVPHDQGNGGNAGKGDRNGRKGGRS